MALHYAYLTANPTLRPYLERANQERAAAIYAGWKAVARAVAAVFHRLAEAHRRAQRARRTEAELSGLSDRVLADIGVSRAEIRHIARAVAAQPPGTAATLAELRRIRSDGATGGTGRGAAFPRDERPRRAQAPRRASRPVERRRAAS